MNTTRIYLIRRPAKLRNGGKVKYWTLRWKRTDGKWHNESIGRVGQMTRAEAEAERDQRMIAMGTGKALRNKPGKLTLTEFLDQDRQTLQAKARSTIRVHKIASDHAIAELGAEFDVEHLTEVEADRIHNRILQKRELNGKTFKAGSKATARKIVATLKAAWNRGIDRKRFTSNPFRAVNVGKVQSKRKRIFSHAEVDAMIAATDDVWWKALLRLAFTSGLRIGELLNLTWDDIDEKAGQVTVSAKRADTFTVGAQTYPILEWSTKSHHERTVPLDGKAAEHLRRLRLQAGGSPYVFLSLARLRMLDSKRIAGKLPDASQWVNNLPRDFGVIQRHAADGGEWRIGCFHDLRCSFGTHMSKAVPMHELQRLMGHSSITVTAEFYTDVSSDLQAKARAVFAQAG